MPWLLLSLIAKMKIKKNVHIRMFGTNLGCIQYELLLVVTSHHQRDLPWQGINI